jgi:hypothetical protein
VSAKGRAAWSAVLGLLATLTLPVAITATRYSGSYDLLHAGFAIPVAAALGVAAVVLARRARALDQASLSRHGRAKTGLLGRYLGILGLCMAASATIAVAVYEVLILAQ